MIRKMKNVPGGVVILCLMLCIAPFLLTACSEPEGEEFTETRLLLDTFCTITIHGDVGAPLMSEAFALITELEQLLSMTVTGSDVWSINHAGGEPITVDPRTIEVISAGLVFSDMSAGKFDITIGRVSSLWDFGSGNNYVPSQDEISDALVTVNYRQVRINEEDNTVQLAHPEAWLDLGAIAKGYIASRVAKLIMDGGATGALVNLGGDVVASGTKNDGSGWNVAIKDPLAVNEEWIGVIEVIWASVTSSGTYERQFESYGVKYHHILDTSTGMPVKSDVVSATLITNTAVIGEGISTIAVLMGSRDVVELFERIPGFIGAVLVLNNGSVYKYGDVEFVE